MPVLRSLRVVMAAALLVGATAGVLRAQPSLSHAAPGAVRPGAELDLDLHGANLTGAVRLWTSFPGTAQMLEQDPGGARLKCRFHVPADAGIGVGGIVVTTPGGATDMLWIAIDDLPSVADPGTNHDPASALEVTAPAAVDGVVDGAVADFYRITAKAGQRIACEVYAARLGSACDPVLRVLDGQGNELGMADDDAALGADCRLAFVAPADGSYFVELRDNKYQGGVRYRLRIGDFPVGAVAHPLAVRGGTADMLQVLTADGEAAPVFFRAPADVEARSVSVRMPGGTSAAAARVRISSLPQYRETEPNDEPAQATKVVLPGGLNGVLNRDEDRDYFEFYAGAGDRLEFHAQARSLASAAYPLVRIYNADGTQLAESPVNELDEFQIAFAFPADGLYRVSVEGLLRSGGSNMAYHVNVDRVPFALSLKNAKDIPVKHALTAQNGALALDLQIQRNGYDDPIQLALDPPSANLELLTPTIAAKAAEARVVLAYREGITEGEVQHVRLVGTASVNGQRYTSAISTLTYLRTKWPALVHPPAWSDGLLTVSVVPTAPVFFETTAETPTVFFPRGVNKANFTLKTQRIDAEYKEAPLLIVQDLPAGVASEQKTENDQHQFTLTASSTLRSGSYPVTAVAFGLHKGRGIVRRVPLLLDVQDPVTLTLQAAGPLTIGQTQKLVVTAARRGADRQPLTIALENLPAGVTAPAITLAADQDRVEIDLTAAADAAAGQHTIAAKGSSQYQGQAITAPASFPLELRTAQ